MRIVTETKNAAQQRGAIDGSLEQLAELVAPFRGGGASRSVYFENLHDPAHPMATSFGPVPDSRAVAESAELLGPRGIWLSQGHCVIGESQRARVESHIAYLAGQGLLPADAAENVIWVGSPSDLASALSCIAQAARQKGSQPSVVPYIQAGEFHDLAQAAGVAVDGPPASVAHAVVDRFYDKLEYRDWAAEALGEQTLVSPRVTFRPGQGRIDADSLERALTLVQGYPHDFSESDRSVLFIQTAVASGGDGNMKVYQRRDGSLYFEDRTAEPRVRREFASLRHLAAFLESWGQSLDITPFVEILRSYTLGIMVGPERATVIGPLEQILDPRTLDYRGFQVSSAGPGAPSYPALDLEMERAARYGQELMSSGFTGWSDEDLFIWRAPDGDLRTARSESNIRRDGMTHLLGPVLANPELGPKLLRGELSLRQEDHVEIPEELADGLDSSEKMARKLAASGVPLMSGSSPYGAVIMAPPARSQASGLVVAIGVVARNDGERDEVMARVKEALGAR